MKQKASELYKKLESSLMDIVDLEVKEDKEKYYDLAKEYGKKASSLYFKYPNAEVMVTKFVTLSLRRDIQNNH